MITTPALGAAVNLDNKVNIAIGLSTVETDLMKTYLFVGLELNGTSVSKVIPIPFEENTADCDQFVNLELFALMILAASFGLFSTLSFFIQSPARVFPLLAVMNLAHLSINTSELWVSANMPVTRTFFL